MKVVPQHDFVLVKPTVDEKTKGGIILPQKQAANDRPDRGEVLAVGPGKHEHGLFIAPKIKAGDQILFQQYPSFEYLIEGQKVFLVRDSQIVAVPQ